MKMALSFICGAVVCGLIMFGVKPVLPASADEVTNPEVIVDTANATQSVSGYISSFDKIYREALTAPFIKAESKIYDADIAEFYHELMDKTGLTNPDAGVPGN